jgi:CTD small phosphatase-like protein 2
VAGHTFHAAHTQHTLPATTACRRSLSSSSFPHTHDDDLLIILDMDECLIHSQFLSGNEYRQQEDRSYEIKESDELACEKFTLELPDGDIVVVNKRPGLDEFLKKVSERWETHIFTAAMSVYASPVLDTLDPDDEIFTQRYYRETCTINEKLGIYVKDLSKIVKNRDLTRVVLVDNNPMSFLAQPSNGILVSNFYDDPRDQTLPAVYNLLDEIDGMKDVRPKLTKMFGLRTALKDVINAK